MPLQKFLTCHECKVSKAQDEYTNSQLKRKGKRKCTECVEFQNNTESYQEAQRELAEAKRLLEQAALASSQLGKEVKTLNVKLEKTNKDLAVTPAFPEPEPEPAHFEEETEMRPAPPPKPVALDAAKALTCFQELCFVSDRMMYLIRSAQMLHMIMRMLPDMSPGLIEVMDLSDIMAGKCPQEQINAKIVFRNFWYNRLIHDLTNGDLNETTPQCASEEFEEYQGGSFRDLWLVDSLHE